MNNQTLFYLNEESLDFPDVNYALTEPNGLLALGGDLSPERLISSYAKGIFPWFSEGDPIMWWSPDPRAVIPVNHIQVNRTLRKFIKRLPYQITLNKSFDQVIELCADAPFRDQETWILTSMLSAYKALHREGHAHSIEIWDGEELVGGLYGVAVGGFFSGESMFYKKTNASKVALIALADLLKTQGLLLIDCQLTNDFLEDMGSIEISRDEFNALREKAIKIMMPDDFWHSRSLSITPT